MNTAGPEDPRKALKRLYGDKHGFFTLPRIEENTIIRSRSSSMYGEIMPTATLRLLDYLELGPKDVLYDLGSGIGKVVVQAAMTVHVRKIVGIELSQSRHDIAAAALAEARTQGLLRTRKVDLRNEDLSQSNLQDATVVYSCSTAFTESFMNRLVLKLAELRPGLRFVSLQDVDDNPYFEEVDVLRLDMSWKKRSKVYVYELVNRRYPPRPDRR